MTRKEIYEHVQGHVDFPADKGKIIASCNRMDDVPKEDREWFERTLPDRTYESPDDVIKALKL